MADRKIAIIGSGIAGVLSASNFRYLDPIIYDAAKQDNLPRHSAIMRLRQPIIGMMLGIPLEEVCVHKAIYYKGQIYNSPSIRFSNMYSVKVNGIIDSRSISNIECSKRFLLGDYYSSARDNFDIRYDHKLKSVDGNTKTMIFESADGTEKTEPYDVCISTIPMDIMLMCVGLQNKYKDVNFEYKPIYVMRIRLNTESNVNQTIYFPDPDFGVYRASIEGRTLIIESTADIGEYNEIHSVFDAFGIKGDYRSDSETRVQKFGKIKNIDDDTRKEIILELTEKYNIYSIGRYAIWKSIRADDIIGDLAVVQKLLRLSDVKRKYLLKT